MKINANYNYNYDGSNNFSHIYKFYNNYQKFKEIKVDHNKTLNLINDKFNISGVNLKKINLLIYLINNNDNNSLVELYDYNTVQIIYNDNADTLKSDIDTDAISSNLGKINTNEESISTNSGKINTNEGAISTNSGKITTNEGAISTNSGKITTNESAISTNSGKIDNNLSNISSNIEKINDNKEDILSLQNSNIKSFYNLDKIFIYDIKKGYQNVNKDNYYHIFEKEIIHNFIKDSYLEIILKVLTEISNLVLIGVFQILCNFYDENDELFYTISLLTAMGSINKLSTIKSVFIVPINKQMTKIKIDFLLCQK